MNLGTILTVFVLAGIVTAIILKIVSDRRKGKCAGCSCGCGATANYRTVEDNTKNAAVTLCQTAKQKT